MKFLSLVRVAAVVVLLAALLTGSLLSGETAAAQSGRQPPKKKVEKKTEEQKESGQTASPQQPDPTPSEPIPPIPRNIDKDEPPIKISTQVVNVETTVVEKKTGRLVPNLTKKNFIIYEDGVKQEITNFASGEGPITVALVLDNNFRHKYYQGNYFDPTWSQEIFQSAASFVHQYIKPGDYAAVITFSMRPKVIQDFTGDVNKLSGALMSAYRDTINFSESNIYDALSFVLVGGKAIQLYEEDTGPSEYTGLEEIEGHTAVILITTGIDTFSRITFDKALRLVGSAGVPIYTVGVGNLFFKKYEAYLGPEARLTFLQAFNQLNAFAERSGGEYYPMTFQGEIPNIMRNIATLLRNQYSIGYMPTNTRREGKERKIKVEVDVDGDGKPDSKQFELRYRQRYTEPGEPVKK